MLHQDSGLPFVRRSSWAAMRSIVLLIAILASLTPSSACWASEKPLRHGFPRKGALSQHGGPQKNGRTCLCCSRKVLRTDFHVKVRLSADGDDEVQYKLPPLFSMSELLTLRLPLPWTLHASLTQAHSLSLQMVGVYSAEMSFVRAPASSWLHNSMASCCQTCSPSGPCSSLMDYLRPRLSSESRTARSSDCWAC